MLAELIGPGDARWRRMLESAPHDVYHLPGYGPLHEQAPGAREAALHVRGAEAELLFPLMLKPLPDLGGSPLPEWWDAASPYGYSGPLVRGAFRPEELERFRDCALDALRRERVLTCFVRGHPFLVEGDPLLDQLGTPVVHGEVAIVELDRPEEQIWGGYARENRRKIRRLVDLGYTVRNDEWSDLDAFAALYRETMARVGAAPFYFFDDDYFRRLKALLGDRLHLMACVSPEGKVVSAALNTACGGVVNGHLSGTAGSHLRLTASMLLYDEGWRWARQRGDRVFNYGGGLGGANDSLFQFKMKFATGSRPFRTVRIVCDERLYQEACGAAGAAGAGLTGFFPAYRQEPRPASPCASRSA